MNTREIKVRKVKISNPNKVLFAKTKTTKLEMIEYYQKVSKYMLKYLDKRLVTELRCHDKNKQFCFYKKHPEGDENVENFVLSKPSVKTNTYFYIKNQTQLISQVQLGTTEFHIWGSKVDKINYPDIMVFDFDPDEKLQVGDLQTQVLNLKTVLDKLNLTSFVKTSGGKGYHVCVPFKPNVTWKKFSEFSRQIALLLEQEYGDKITTTISKKERKGKIFIDFLRNKKGATCVCPYSVRAKDTPYVSMPIAWNEVKKYAPNYFTIYNVTDKLLKLNPWKNFFLVKQTLK